MKRIALFVMTNVAILVVISVVFQLLGRDGIQTASGQLDLTALLIMSAIIGFMGSFISLAISKWMALRSTGAQVIKQPRNEIEAWLLSTVQRQAQQAGIGMPDVAIYDAPEVNAFATGARRNSALVAVSTGLLRSMTRDEAEAVLGHEVGHVANGDMITLTLIQGVVNTFVVFLSRLVGYFVDRVLLKNEEGLGIGYFVSSIIAQIVLGILASTIVCWFSRQREFRADEAGAQLASREKMTAALRRLQAQQGAQSHLPQEMAAFGIFGGRSQGWRALFMTHPPLEARIEALQKQGFRQA
ncbi:MAG: protease HtpX [Pseudomonadota bacterium]